MSFFIEDQSTLDYVTFKDNKRIADFRYPCDDPYDCHPFIIQLTKGCYYLEVYGAQGGNPTGNYNGTGGKGGYSSGIYCSYMNRQTLYLYIGANNKASYNKTLLFNGGGYGQNPKDGPGGGATDFRLYDDTNNNSLSSRIIVAGGCGGAYGNIDGGAGGGIEGEQGKKERGLPCYGTQFNCSGGYSTGEDRFNPGSFGVGGSNYFGGGGGGYFGGGNAASSGSGGSGYIGGVFGNSKYPCKTITGINENSGRARITVIGRLQLTCVERTSGRLYILISLFFYKT